METELHLLQIFLLIETLRAWWKGRDDVYVGGDMFVYFSPNQVYTHDFRGPDVLVAQGVKKRVRKSWVTWQEGKPPDVVIELMSKSTAKFDKTVKKRIYQDRLRTPEYFLYDPVEYEFLGYSLRNGRYEPIEPDAAGRLVSEQLGLALQVWDGDYANTTSRWLRCATLDGTLLPTKEERIEEEMLRVEEANLRAEEEMLRAEAANLHAQEAERKAEELEAEIARYRERFGDVTE
jgi:Uma2 family endonuclease